MTLKNSYLHACMNQEPQPKKTESTPDPVEPEKTESTPDPVEPVLNDGLNGDTGDFSESLSPSVPDVSQCWVCSNGHSSTDPTLPCATCGEHPPSHC